MSITKEEVWEMFREVARRSQETERMLQESAREARERSVELDRKFQETDRKIKEITQSIGRLGNRLGEFVEEMVRPAVVRIFQARGIAVHEVHRRVSSKRDGEEMEVDLLVVNDTDAVAIEVKSELSVADVKEHVERMARFKKMFPHYRGFNVMGAVAAMVVPEDVAKFAYRQGLFVLGQSGESVEIRNGLDFQPTVW
ncbi:MAG: DUF3782 domain-containing protein [Candidatus Methylumidiphilus sp.]